MYFRSATKCLLIHLELAYNTLEALYKSRGGPFENKWGPDPPQPACRIVTRSDLLGDLNINKTNALNFLTPFMDSKPAVLAVLVPVKARKLMTVIAANVGTFF